MELIDTVFEAAQNSAKFEKALDLYNEMFDLKSSVIFSIHDFTEARQGFYWSDFVKNNLPAGVREKLERGDDKDERKAYEALAHLPPLTPYTEPTLFGVSRYEDMPPSEFRSAGEALGVYHRVSCMLNQSGPWMDALFVHGESAFPAQRYCNDKTVQILMPVMSNAIELSRTTRALRKKYAATLAALDHLGLGVFLLDERGHVLERNRAAKDILAMSDGLNLGRDGRLSCALGRDNNILTRSLEAAFDMEKQGTDRSIHKIERPSGKHDYLWSLSCLQDADGEFETHARFGFLSIIDPTKEGHLSADGLRVLGDLTDAETAVVEGLVRGMRVSEIALVRDVQENSIRVQLKTIFQKLRCSSQADVVRLASTTRLPIE